VKIVGRENEKALLQNCLDSGKPEFLAVYGRRRVGKTFLVREFFGERIVFSLSGAVNTTMKRQLRNFDEALAETGDVSERAADWFEAFRFLKDHIKRLKRKGKKVIFIDELPWLATQKSGFLSALDHFWNTFVSAREDLLLVICGSATSWIVDNVINDRGGLHNRVTKQLWVGPFSLGECERFYREKGIDLNRIQMAELYMVFGGIPFYMDYAEKGLSPEQIVDKMFFARHAPLANEFANLYAALFKNSGKHIRVVEILGKVGAGMTQKELYDVLKTKPSGSLTKVLKELEQCGFIRRYRDFTKKKNCQYYQLVDFFSLFYLKHMKSMAEPDVKYWQNQGRGGSRNAWAGFAFERVCAAHILQIKQKLGIAGVSTEISAWRSVHANPGAQIDLVINREDGIINLCEMKFTAKPFNIDAKYDGELMAKRETFRDETKTKKALHVTMVTTGGLTPGSLVGMIQAQVLLDDLYA
jgi:DNA-binding MarR family transcriptional regulator